MKPLQIPQLEFWVKADKGVYKDAGKSQLPGGNGDVVAVWADQGFKGRDANNAGGSLTLVTNSQNGLPGIQMLQGSNQSIQTASFVIAAPFTIVAAIKFVNPLTNHFAGLVCSADGNNTGLLSDTGTAYMWDGIKSSIAAGAAKPGIVHIEMNSATCQTYLGNVLKNTGTLTNTSMTGLLINYNPGAGGFGYNDCTYYEIAVFSRILLPLERTYLYMYLHNKWNI
jgi:hypothetical protein